MPEWVFIDSRNIATFTCRTCGRVWKRDLSPLMDRIAAKSGRPVRFKYPCGHSRDIVFEKRRYRRKKARLTGAFIHERSRRRGIIEIKNISKSGVGFELNSKQFMHVGDRLSLKFNLDDPLNSFVYEEVIVKKIEGEYVGVEFCEFRHRDTLEDYLQE